MPKGTEDRRVGRALPSPVTPASNICFRITIPDAVPYRAALVGSLAELTQWYAWDHPRGVNDCPDCEEAAQLWSAALAGSTYTEECEDTLSCEEIINCIETNPDTQQAIIDFMLANPDINEYITNIIGAQGLTETQTNQNLLKPDVCEFGNIFNQASVVIDLLHTITTDLFEAVEVGTNAIERAELLVNILGVGTRALVVDTILQVADMLIETVQEEYEGAYDTALYDTLRCGLFCQVKDSCVMTFEDIASYYRNKLEVSLPTDVYQAIEAIADFILIGDFPGDTVVYAMHALVLSLIQTGEEVLGINFTRLGLRIIAAAGTSDSAWETLCEDCTELPNARMIPVSGWNDDDFEFIDNLDPDTSRYMMTFRSQGGYAGGGGQTVGGLQLYITDVDNVDGISWPDGSFLTSFGAYKWDTVPCYLPTTLAGMYTGDVSVYGKRLRITVSRNPCPIWGPAPAFPTWGVITEQTPTTLTVEATDIGGGNWRAAFHTIDGLVFHVNTIVFSTTVGFGSHYNAANVEVPGTAVAGLDIQGLYCSMASSGTVTITGYVVP